MKLCWMACLIEFEISKKRTLRFEKRNVLFEKNALFTERHVLHMVVHIDVRHISGLIPFWLLLHVIRDDLSVDGEILETDVLHFSAFVVTGYDAHVRLIAVVGDVAQGDILDASARG